MKRTTAPNSAGGLFVDKVPGVTTGTTVIAEDLNNHQEEIAKAIEGANITLSGLSQTQLRDAIIALSHQLGEPVFNVLELAPSASFPAVRIDDGDHDLDAANWPDLVPALRAQKLKSDGTTDFAVNVAAGVVTFLNQPAENRLLAALAEEVLVHGGYASWLALNLGGTDYAISNVNAGAHTITVAAPPGDGAYTAIVYPYRVAGAATARLRRMSARALVGTQAEAGDAVAEHLLGMRRRDRMQGHAHTVLTAVGGGGTPAIQTTINSTNSGAETSATTGKTASVVSDGTNGTPRIGGTTDPRSYAMPLYIWGRRYIP